MIKAAVILLFLAKEIYDIILNRINDTYSAGELPENVRDVYDAEEYRRWRAYKKDRSTVFVARKIVSMVILTLFLLFDVYAFMFDMASGCSIYLQYLLVTLALVLMDGLISLPASYYSVFVIEERYGMNRTTRKTFFLDELKDIAVNTVITFLVIALIMFLFERFGNMIILLGTAVMVVVSLAVSLIIIPLMRIYNKFAPLEDGELKEKLTALCEKYGIRVRKIVVKDASRRTTKANAFCTGLGNRKTISLDDNLVNGFDEDEIVAVFAHEFGHAKYRHMIKSLPFGIARTVLAFAAMAVALNLSGLYGAFGFDGLNYYMAVTLASVFLWPVTELLDILSNGISRKHEYEADAFATREGYGEALISALKRLNKESLSEINPHPLMVLLSYSHPTLSQRIAAIEESGMSFD